ncbi:MAG: radical SAM protein [Bacteroides sp.]|nr:radical SAM protein [Bacteroides sp.]MCM1472294.1 radical SAM protein [Bacteroides sp.]
MDIYKTLKRVTGVKSPRLRLLMLWLAYVGRRRMIGVYIDPVVACNLRCRMCAFSDPEARLRLKGRMTDGQLSAVARGLYSRALKVQIGCGAEPTLDNRISQIIADAKNCGVPYVSVTTNGQRLTLEMLQKWVDEGLDELTLSMHGTSRDTYEWLMDGASFEQLKAVLEMVRVVKCDKGLRLRVNYTVNADNFEELNGLFDLVGDCPIDVVQVRPVQKLGETSYNNFDLTPIKRRYDEVIGRIAEECKRRGVACLVPGRDDLDRVNERVDDRELLFEFVTYCYVDHAGVYSSDDFYRNGDDFRLWHRRNHTGRKLLSAALLPGFSRKISKDTTVKLNYNVK